jgi:hypothetical protein
VQYLRDIIEVLAEGNILTSGTLSLQSMDPHTLDTINRANIKTERYDALAVEMKSANLPLNIELMMGLPGSTVASFCEDLQQCIDRELPVRVNMTTMLVNSPMNHPDYVKKNKIETLSPIAPGSNAMLISTSTYSSDDLRYMQSLRDCYMLFENFGTLRVFSRFVRQEAGGTEIQFYEKLFAAAANENEWPLLNLFCFIVPSFMAPLVSWHLLLTELSRFIEFEYGIVDSPARRSIVTAQLACLPSHDRNYPETYSLECDVTAWFSEILEQKTLGNRRNWPDHVGRLGTFGPGTLTVGDPYGVTASTLGVTQELNSFGVNWELESPLHRPRGDLR